MGIRDDNMECGECEVRSSVGFCHECEMLLCEVCSHTCERCKKTVCKSHIQRTSSGRRICVSCVVHHYDKRAKQTKERREMRAEAAVDGGPAAPKKHKRSSSKGATTPAAAPVDSFSFQSLQEGVDEHPGVPIVGPPVDHRPAGPPSRGPVGETSGGFTPLVDENALNERVLTGSASARTPTWMSGLAMSVLAWFMCLASFSGSELGIQQGIFNLLALIIGFGAVIWTGPSSFAKGDKSLRTRSRLALAVGASALLLSGVTFYLRVNS